MENKSVTACGIYVCRMDKNSDWGQNLVVKVEYKRNNGENITNECYNFYSKFCEKYLKKFTNLLNKYRTFQKKKGNKNYFFLFLIK